MNRLFLSISFLVLSILSFFTFYVYDASAKALFETEQLPNLWIYQYYVDFQPSEGDYFLVDIEDAVGYLVNDYRHVYTAFPVMTGGKRTPTPEKDWVVLQKNIQPNRVFFAESGEFFRMFLNDGETRTSYGIHGYKYFDEEVEKGTKYLSWGCVMVADDVLDMIEASYIANGESLRVSTRSDVKVF